MHMPCWQATELKHTAGSIRQRALLLNSGEVGSGQKAAVSLSLAVQEFVPTVHERAPIFVPTRPEDRRLGMKLGAFVLGAIRELHPVVGQQGALSTALA